ncbi:MAG: hypothetical protein FWG30_05545 [Eubacteriaceae bacterium]|nr:hypothetical protein [Eubacteriaceae bacterium]
MKERLTKIAAYLRNKAKEIKLPKLSGIHWNYSIAKIIVYAAIALLLAAALFLTRQPPKQSWFEEDFIIYSFDKQIHKQPSLSMPVCILQDPTEEAKTYRGIGIGDEARDLLSAYDWKDWEFVVFGNGEEYGNYDLTKEYNAKISNANDFASYLDDFSEKGYAAKLRVLVYKQNGRLVTRSHLNGKDGLQAYQKLMYIFAAEIEDGCVHTIVVENNYYRELAKCYAENNGLVPDNENYKWLKLLGQ